MKDIENAEDVVALVDAFYAKVHSDLILSPVFNTVIGNQWDKHLQKMYGFWQTVLLDVQAYSGSPFLAHAKLPIEKVHFERWLSLFHETVDELFVGEKATEAKWRADRMGEMFQYKLDYYKNNPTQPLI